MNNTTPQDEELRNQEFTESYNILSRKHREEQRKFDYFLLGVTLGILALSIQTYKPDYFLSWPFLIVLFWVLFLTSFLMGMYRQEQFNKFIDNEKTKLNLNHYQHSLELAEKGDISIKVGYDQYLSPQEIDTELRGIKDDNERVSDTMAKFQKRISAAYQVQKWSFVSGLIIYAILRTMNF